MLFSRSLSSKLLIALCRRISISLETGVDVRTVFQREAQTGPNWFRHKMQDAADLIERGQGVSEALGEVGPALPELVHSMVRVGEQTGHLDTVFARLAEHYEMRNRMHRDFWSTAWWPIFQFAISLVVIGFLIAITGWLRSMPGNEDLDIIGLGLYGFRGLLVYVSILSAIVIAGFMLLRAAKKGSLWVGSVQRVILLIPKLGNAIRTLALARMAWTLDIALDSGMDTTRALRLGLNSTYLIPFIKSGDSIADNIARGTDIYTTMLQTNLFPTDFLDAVRVGEESGRLPETMGRLAVLYQEEARAAMRVLSTVAGFVVWAIVAMMIIAMIFTLAGFYAKTIEDMSSPNYR